MNAGAFAASRTAERADQRNERRLGKQRGAKVAQIEIARRLAHAIWHMLTRNEEFAPRGLRVSSGGLIAPLDLRRERTSNDLVLPDEEAIET